MKRLLSVVALSLSCASMAFAATYDQGADDRSIRIGNTGPLSGPVSSYGIFSKTMNAYLNMLNEEQGGINGRKIEFITYDDSYSPPKTIESVRRLVEKDGVLFIAGTTGTAPNMAVRKYLNSKKVPHLLVTGGGNGQFNLPKEFPWSVGVSHSYEAEMKLYATHMMQTVSTPRIAVLYQNDDAGKGLLNGLKAALGDKAGELIIAESSYEVSDPTVDSQMAQLAASKANVFFNLTLPKAGAQAIRKAHAMGWKPEAHYIFVGAAGKKATFVPAGLEAAKGIYTAGIYKDPSQSVYAHDEKTKKFHEFMDKYLPAEDRDNAMAVTGYTLAQLLAHVIEKAGDDLTRENIVRQATSLDHFAPPMIFPGITLANSPEQTMPFHNLQLLQFNGDEFVLIGDGPTSIR